MGTGTLFGALSQIWGQAPCLGAQGFGPNLPKNLPANGVGCSNMGTGTLFGRPGL